MPIVVPSADESHRQRVRVVASIQLLKHGDGSDKLFQGASKASLWLIKAN